MVMPVLQPPLPHGGKIEAYAQRWGCATADILDLSTGLHPAGAPTWLPQWLKEHADLVAHYPDSQGEPARSALAAWMGVDAENVLMLAGAQAAIEVLPQAMGWQSMALRQPCYSEPIRAAERVGCSVLGCAMGSPWPEHVDSVWLTSPHNPCGSVEDFPVHQHGVLDESYMSFAQRKTLGVMPDVLRLGSLTKTFCIPGLRLGYVIAEEARLHRLQTWLPPWPASTLGLHLLPHLLEQSTMRDNEAAMLRNRLENLLKTCGWQVKPSAASFVLAKAPVALQGGLPDFDSQRIIVRTFPEWESLQGWVRFGLPKHAHDWHRLGKALKRKL